MVAAARLVGNDVVDLDEPDNGRSFRAARFVARIASAEERARIASAREPYVLVASLFAAKEAAFKVVAKLAPDTVFAHRRFRVGAELDAVEYDGLRLALRVERGEGFVHAVASTEGSPTASARLDAGVGDLGIAARALARELAAARLACDASEIAIVRPPRPGSWDGFGPPRVERCGAPVGIDVSLSHDGRFVAAAIAATVA